MSLLLRARSYVKTYIIQSLIQVKWSNPTFVIVFSLILSSRLVFAIKPSPITDIGGTPRDWYIGLLQQGWHYSILLSHIVRLRFLSFDEQSPDSDPACSIAMSPRAHHQIVLAARYNITAAVLIPGLLYSHVPACRGCEI
jgi:hypothetical protein